MPRGPTGPLLSVEITHRFWGLGPRHTGDTVHPTLCVHAFIQKILARFCCVPGTVPGTGDLDNHLDLLELWFQSRGTVALTHLVCHPGESQQTSLERRKGSLRKSQSSLLPLMSSPGYSQGSHRAEQDSPARPQGPTRTGNA